jgi:CRP-like cAMP-binding protein
MNIRMTLSNLDDIALEDALARLRRITIFTEAQEATLTRLVPDLLWRELAAGEMLITHLATDRYVYFIFEGVFRAKIEPSPGRSVQIRQLYPGDHVGEIAVLAQSPRSVSVSAQTRGLVAQCPEESLLAIMHADASVAVRMASALARYVISLTDRLFETASLEVRFRIYAELLRLAKKGEPTEDGLLIREAPTHELIAQSVGTHREAVTKEFSLLNELKILRQQRRELVLLDLEKLRQLVQSAAGVTASQLVDW